MRVEIVNDRICTRVFLDGEEVHRVSSVKVEQTVGQKMSVVMELLPDEVEIHAEDAEVKKLTLEDKAKEEGYKDFIRFLFRGKYGIKEETDDKARTN